LILTTFQCQTIFLVRGVVWAQALVLGNTTFRTGPHDHMAVSGIERSVLDTTLPDPGIGSIDIWYLVSPSTTGDETNIISLISLCLHLQTWILVKSTGKFDLTNPPHPTTSSPFTRPGVSRSRKTRHKHSETCIIYVNQATCSTKFKVQKVMYDQCIIRTMISVHVNGAGAPAVTCRTGRAPGKRRPRTHCPPGQQVLHVPRTSGPRTGYLTTISSGLSTLSLMRR